MAGEGSSTNFKRKILQVIRDLTNNGKHLEASQLYQKYFGEDNGKDRPS